MKSDKHETWQDGRFQYCCEGCTGPVVGPITDSNTLKKRWKDLKIWKGGRFPKLTGDIFYVQPTQRNQRKFQFRLITLFDKVIFWVLSLKKNTIGANSHLRYWYIFPKGQYFFMSRDPVTQFSWKRPRTLYCLRCNIVTPGLLFFVKCTI